MTIQLFADTDGDGNSDGPVLDSTTTSKTGEYVFNGLSPGDFVVVEIQPENFLTVLDGDSTVPNDDLENGSLTDDSIPVSVVAGETDNGNDFVEFAAKADTYEEFAAEYADVLGTENAPSDNPDGDIFPNALEYAFWLNPGSGTSNAGQFCVTKDPGTGEVTAEFMRARGGLSDVTYTLEGADTLGTPTVWLPITSVSETINITDADIPADSEKVLFNNLELATELTDGTVGGVVRVRVDLNGESFFTNPFGWQCIDFNDYECATFSSPFSEKPVFSGTFAGEIQDPENLNNPVTLTTNTAANGDVTFDVSDSAFGADLSSLVGTNGEYYLQITSGVFEGNRFDIVGGGVNSITLLNDDDIFDTAVPSLNTLEGLPNDASLNGVSYQVIRYRTVDDVFTRDFAFAGEEDSNPSDATRLLFYDARQAVPGFDSLRLVGTAPNTSWVRVSDLFLPEDQGGRRLDPAIGSWIHPKSSGNPLAPTPEPPVRMFTAGMIADHDQAVALNEGFNLTASMWPIDQTPAGDQTIGEPSGRDLTLAAGFDGGAAPSSSTQILFWRGDQVVDDVNVTEYETGYNSFMLGDAGPFTYWLNRASPFVNLDATLMLESHRAVILSILAGDEKRPHIYPRPNF